MNHPHSVSAGSRIGSMLLDHICMTVVAMIFLFIPFIGSFSEIFNVGHEQPGETPVFSGPLMFIAIIGFALYFCKDSFNGRSIGKRAARLQVLNSHTGEVASPLKCLVRNLFIIIWPIEVIVTLINPERRIGDRVAGTRVAPYEPTLREQRKAGLGQLLLPLVIAYAMFAVFAFPMQALTATEQVRFDEKSYNEAASKELEQLFNQQLGEYCTASVRVYDKIEGQSLKYISILLRLKENYLEADNGSEELLAQSLPVLYEKVDKETFTGMIKFVYQREGTMRIYSTSIGGKVRITHIDD
ncbi:RDD family protein [Paraflavitalea sp. CAU 1676]|uniref:RDD family protein n=1 Tax=Paraflavitalea sp. CAU 1676 TaxID=3032598 RepID=UPI0023DC9627|nr:RDD family protein [Paraflavitalea sp. CAU 1676]MDF2189339.1 RDD family protein [Paraflavitalea sp. CAU 1676]